jgi:hypothetical protein
MKISDCEPSVSPDGNAVTFTLSVRGHEAQAVITRDALEKYFWLPPGADVTRTLRTFEDGHSRIISVAQRKFLARPEEQLSLTARDFVSS